MFYVLLLVLFCIVALIFLPLFSDEDNRQLWWRRFRQCRWVPIDPAWLQASVTGRRVVAPNRVSKEALAQEDAIRKAFVQEKLQPYTKTVTADILAASHHRSVVITDTLPCRETEDTVQSDQPANAHVDDVETGLDAGTLEPRDTDNDHDQKQPTSQTSLQVIHQSKKATVMDASRHGTILVPHAGQQTLGPATTTQQQQQRQESSTCAICLSAFGVADAISWSSNAACPHMFHQSCIGNWLVTSGAKHLARQRRRNNASTSAAHDPEDATTTLEEVTSAVTNFPMLCPCCRQPFILIADESRKDVVVDGSTTGSSSISELSSRDATTTPTTLAGVPALAGTRSIIPTV